MADERLQDATNQQRTQFGSSASIFMPEAHNHFPHGDNSDSYDSGSDSEMHESDHDFLLSQGSEISINKKQGDYDIENIYMYIWFKINEKQSLEMNCNDCNTARVFETVFLLVQIILTTGECARGT